jgi:WXG100 family type VII secretion target
MSEILLRAEDARAAAGQMRTARDAAAQQVTSVRQRLTELKGSFKGKTATAFDAKFEEWRLNADGLLESLQGLSGFLDQAANIIEQTDQDIASRLG